MGIKLSDKVKENYHSAFLFADEIARLEDKNEALKREIIEIEKVTDAHADKNAALKQGITDIYIGLHGKELKTTGRKLRALLAQESE